MDDPRHFAIVVHGNTFRDLLLVLESFVEFYGQLFVNIGNFHVVDSFARAEDELVVGNMVELNPIPRSGPCAAIEILRLVKLQPFPVELALADEIVPVVEIIHVSRTILAGAMNVTFHRVEVRLVSNRLSSVHPSLLADGTGLSSNVGDDRAGLSLWFLRIFNPPNPKLAVRVKAAQSVRRNRFDNVVTAVFKCSHF